jgi:hypothetical protein
VISKPLQGLEFEDIVIGEGVMGFAEIRLAE